MDSKPFVIKFPVSPVSSNRSDNTSSDLMHESKDACSKENEENYESEDDFTIIAETGQVPSYANRPPAQGSYWKCNCSYCDHQSPCLFCAEYCYSTDKVTKFKPQLPQYVDPHRAEVSSWKRICSDCGHKSPCLFCAEHCFGEDKVTECKAMLPPPVNDHPTKDGQ